MIEQRYAEWLMRLSSLVPSLCGHLTTFEQSVKKNINVILIEFQFEFLIGKKVRVFYRQLLEIALCLRCHGRKSFRYRKLLHLNVWIWCRFIESFSWSWIMAKVDLCQQLVFDFRDAYSREMINVYYTKRNRSEKVSNQHWCLPEIVHMWVWYFNDNFSSRHLVKRTLTSFNN